MRVVLFLVGPIIKSSLAIELVSDAMFLSATNTMTK
jgi:hypothetical protein